MKIARHPNPCVTAPPRAGPSAAPNVPASVQTVAPRGGDPVSTVSAGSDPASNNAAPTPWTPRAAMRNARLLAAEHAIEAAVKIRSPAPRTVTARARCTTKTSASAATATAALYEVTTHATPSIVVWNCVYSSGSASTTIDESANATPTDATTSATKRL